MRRHLFICCALLYACRSTVTSVNPNNLTEEEQHWHWKHEDVPGKKNDWFAIHGSDYGHVFIVGKGGRMLNYDGVKWTEVTSPTTEDLFAVFIVNSSQG